MSVMVWNRSDMDRCKYIGMFALASVSNCSVNGIIKIYRYRYLVCVLYLFTKN
jgi:hypothetical protein